MLYHSTRSSAPCVDSAQAVLTGLAPDGGLYMPEYLPDFDWRNCLRLSAQGMSCAILSALLPDIPEMETLVSKAYTGKFQTEELTPTASAGDFHVLELFRGPTSAFKDVARRKNTGWKQTLPAGVFSPEPPVTDARNLQRIDFP